MAVRRLNYTGRKRLNHGHTSVTVQDHDDEPSRFNINMSLENYDLPQDALVFVEAQRQTTFMRFRHGTVAEPRFEDKPALAEFDSPDGVLFRVKIISAQEPEGLILAEADKIRPRKPEENEEERVPLLPARADPSLGYQVFRLDFSDRPILLVNADLSDWHSVVRDPVFASLVYPTALREILNRVLYVEKCFDIDDPELWQSQWLRFGSILPGMMDPPSEDEPDRFDDWIDDAVEAFCRKFKMTERFNCYWEGE